MFRHVVMFRWNDDVDDDHIGAVSEALTAMAGEIDVISTYRHGRDAGVNDGNWDYVVVADFATKDDYVVYRDHPDHRALIEEFIAGRTAERAAVQYDAG